MTGTLAISSSASALTVLSTVPARENSGLHSANPTGKLVSLGGQALPVRSAEQPVPQIDFARVVRQLHAFIENGHRSLHFRQDAATGRTVELP